MEVLKEENSQLRSININMTNIKARSNVLAAEIEELKIELVDVKKNYEREKKQNLKLSNLLKKKSVSLDSQDKDIKELKEEREVNQYYFA